jgi:hypothetical protein
VPSAQTTTNSETSNNNIDINTSADTDNIPTYQTSSSNDSSSMSSYKKPPRDPKPGKPTGGMFPKVALLLTV